MKVIIFNEYMQNIYLGFDEVWNYIAKGVMENHYKVIYQRMSCDNWY